MERITHWMDGRAFPSTSTSVGPLWNPATGEQQGEVPFATPAEIDTIIASSRNAAASWNTSSLSRRTEILFQFRHLLATHTNELASVISREHGKVHSDAVGEVSRALENVEFACGLAQHLKGQFSSQVAGGIDVHSLLQPLGIVAGITPFNFPAMVPLWMAANAIACGNAFICKPSEKDPSSALFLAQLWTDAGLPDGVFNVIQGNQLAVETLLEHSDISAISFVGSTPIAKSIYERASKAGKRVQALGGAKNHMVVLPDADVAMAADAAVSAAYGSAGERCMAVSVVVAVGAIGDALVEAIASRLSALRIGAGDDPTSEMGPLITREHRDKVASYLPLAAEEGATIVVDGRERTFDGPAANGFFLGASLVDQVKAGMAIYDDEIFGPVLSVVRCATYEEATALVNANQYGNGVALFTRDGGAARRFTSEVTCGMVGINVPIPVPVASYSFGGWKDSLFGSHHMYGPEGIEFFTRSKVVTSRWPDPATSTVDLGFPRTR